MNDYRKLSIRYLKLNRKRSVITIVGVAVAAMILYILLNLGWSSLLMLRQELREQQDYEIVFLTENQSQIKQIMEDDRVKSAWVGKYYVRDYYNPVIYESALYINTKNPYRMRSIKEQLEHTYGIKSALNSELAMTYMQLGNDNLVAVLFLATLLVSFVFAIFGVGIIRNSIQLCTLEQIKDYGNLRCVGASKGQLKTIIYLEGAILEISGIVFGILGGTVGSMIIGHYLKWEVSFHLVPILPILIAFLGDLYFAMEENCKVIVNLTPISAIRGEYRIRKEKIKVRRQSIFGKLFGVEGDYAYKSIMRNPGRFCKTVAALGLGVAAFMAVAGSTTATNDIIKDIKDRYKYYHVYYESTLDLKKTKEEILSSLPPTEVFERIKALDEVSEAKRLYSSHVVLKDWKENITHYNQEYLSQAAYGVALSNMYNTAKKDASSSPLKRILSESICYGYDEMDFKRYEDVLVEGTLDVSENGLVLVNGGNVTKDSTDAVLAECIDVEYTNYKVGDTIEFLDMGKLRSMMGERLEQLSSEYKTEKDKISHPNSSETNVRTTEKLLDDLYVEYREKKDQALAECEEQLHGEGTYKTYTIEGIVKDDVNHYSEEMVFILPLEQYYAFTGTDETMISGMQYHFEKYSSSRFWNAVSYKIVGENTEFYARSDYSEYMDMFERMQNLNKGVMVFILFVVLMSTLNIINTTASNLHLRRKEFAQLRVLGVSQKRLMKIVMLEGVISSIVANLIGIILGIVMSGVSTLMVLVVMFRYSYQFPILPALLGILVSTLILCGSIYVPIRSMKQNMAGDMAAGGD